MSKATTWALLALLTAACQDEPTPGQRMTRAVEEVKNGAAQARDGIVTGWDAMVDELAEKKGELEQRIEEAKPEVKARLESLRRSFDEQLARARQKLAEAKEAAPEKVETLKREAREAYERAKEAWNDATSGD